MAFNLRDKFNRALNTLFAAGNAGIVTDLIDNGAEIGSQFAAGNSGLTTGLLSRTGADIGSLFALIGGGGALGVNVTPSTYSLGLLAPGSHNTGNMTATPSGGTGTGYTYAWTGTGLTFTAPTSAVTNASFNVGSHGGAQNLTATCTVHDSGSHVATDTCAISFSGPP